jgi:hypothetical protein
MSKSSTSTEVGSVDDDTRRDTKCGPGPVSGSSGTHLSGVMSQIQ